MKIFAKILTALLGALYCFFILVFLLLSTPVYLFRLFAIFLAKLTRPDLGDVLNGQSAIFVGDYMLETPPRSNVVFALIFEGQLTIEQVRARVMKNWIGSNEKSNFENFQRYPVKWLGFTFWKDAADTFSVESHVIDCKFSPEAAEITDKQLTEIMESLLNERTPKFQSPWTLQLISNYKNPCTQTTENTRQHSALIFQWHHCLVDGIGAMTALVEALFEQPWVKKPESPPPKSKGWQNILRTLTVPAAITSKLSWFLSHSFRENPFKIPDNRKCWHQVCASSGPIPIEHVKSIKNAFRVSYTSVLLSAISVAAHRILGDSQAQETKSMLCLSVLLARGNSRRKILSNHMTGALFELPCVRFANPVERLRIVNGLLEKSRASVVPVCAQIISTLVGAHVNVVNSGLMDNKMVAIGLSNFAGVPENIELNKNTKWVHTKFIGGSFVGVQGLTIAAISHGLQTEIVASAERALMSREEVEKFTEYIKDEIANLRILITGSSYFENV